MSNTVWEKEISQIKEMGLLGRVDPKQMPLRLHWAMSGLCLHIRCSELHIELEAAYSDLALWGAVLIDGAVISRFPLKRGRHWYTVLMGMDPLEAHEVSIVRDTQPIAEDPAMRLTLHSVRSDGELLPVEPAALTVEFIGDSLTSGEGCVGPVNAMEWKTVYISAANTYAQMVCRDLHARGRWLSMSGWGVTSSWDGDRECRLPRVYNDLCDLESDGHVPYDFAGDPADLVVINLGTNDANALSQLPREQQPARRQEIQKDAEDFIRRIRAKNPGAYILWAYGMCGAPLGRTLRKAVETVRQAGDLRVGYLALPVGRADEIGSRAHPGIPAHRRTAKAILDYWRQIK